MNKLLFTFVFLCTSLLYGQQTIKNLQWLNVNRIITQSSIGNDVTLYAQTENIDNDEPVKITIWSKGDEKDDLVGEYHSIIRYNQIVFNWVLAFDIEKMENSMKEIEANGFTIPQYYFIIQYNTIKSEDSNLLAVKDTIRKQILFEGTNIPAINRGYTLLLPDKTIINGKTDYEGYVYIENLIIGTYYFYLHEEGDLDDLDDF